MLSGERERERERKLEREEKGSRGAFVFFLVRKWREKRRHKREWFFRRGRRGKKLQEK